MPTGVAKGAMLTVAMRWTDRLIGIASTMILARILVPDDFGIIAMASLVIGLTDVMLDLGVHVALIRNSNATQADYDTAWTLRLIQSTLSAAVVIATAPLAAAYFHDPRITPVLYVLAIGLILPALENIGIITFQKEMRFGLDFKFTFLKRISGFMVTVGMALLLHSYWALVFGTLLGRVVGVALSYRMHPMRPRFSLEKFKEIFGVSQWMLLRGILQYLNVNAHKFLVGGRATADVLGGYTLASQIAAMPSTELLQPLNRVLFPAFVKARDNPEELKRVFLLSQGVQTLIAIPGGIGLILLAHEAVSILLGPKWLFVAPFVQILAVANLAQAISASGSYLLMTVGEFAWQTMLVAAELAVFAAAAFLLIPTGGAIEIAWVRVAAIGLGLILFVSLLLRRVAQIKLPDILRTIYRPLVAGTLMGLALHAIDSMLSLGMVSGLVAKTTVGAVVYLGVVYALWRLGGRPAGGERYIAEKLAPVLHRKK